MDELRIISKFTTGLISKIVSKFIVKKTGYRVDVQFNDIKTTVGEKKAHVHLDLNVECDKDDLMKIIKSFGL